MYSSAVVAGAVYAEAVGAASTSTHCIPRGYYVCTVITYIMNVMAQKNFLGFRV